MLEELRFFFIIFFLFWILNSNFVIMLLRFLDFKFQIQFELLYISKFIFDIVNMKFRKSLKLKSLDLFIHLKVKN